MVVNTPVRREIHQTHIEKLAQFIYRSSKRSENLSALSPFSSNEERMIIHAMTHRIIGMILKQAERRSFVPLVGLAAFLSTLSMSVPVEWLVVVATLASRSRWVTTASIAAFGSAIASLGLYLAFHHFGWNILLERYPELAGARAWLQATDWLSRYGPLALFGLMAVPLPSSQAAHARRSRDLSSADTGCLCRDRCREDDQIPRLRLHHRSLPGSRPFPDGPNRAIEPSSFSSAADPGHCQYGHEP